MTSSRLRRVALTLALLAAPAVAGHAMGIVPPPPQPTGFSVQLDAKNIIARWNPSANTVILWLDGSALTATGGSQGQLVYPSSISRAVGHQFKLVAVNFAGQSAPALYNTTPIPVISTGCPPFAETVYNASTSTIHVELWGAALNVYETSLAAGKSQSFTGSVPSAFSGNSSITESLLAFRPGAPHGDDVECDAHVTIVNGCPKSGVDAIATIKDRSGFPDLSCSVVVP